MDEARRFLRYVTPGLLYGLEVFLFLWILFPGWTTDVLVERLLLPNSRNGGLGTAVTVFLASGALGYLFATLHHCVHWRSCTDKGIIDHTEGINGLRSAGLLPQSQKVCPNARLEAFDQMTTLWFSRLKSNSPIGNAAPRVSGMDDLAHSAGTARIASMFALLTALAVAKHVSEWNPTAESVCRFITVFVLAVLTTLLFHDAYRRTGGMAARQYDRLAELALLAERTPEGSLDFTSSPDGAEIELEGTLIGSTPRSKSLRVGEYRVAIKKEGYKDWERKIAVSDGEDLKVPATLEPNRSARRRPPGGQVCN